MNFPNQTETGVVHVDPEVGSSNQGSKTNPLSKQKTFYHQHVLTHTYAVSSSPVFIQDG